MQDIMYSYHRSAPKETRREKKERIHRELAESEGYMYRRIRQIAQTYSFPLKQDYIERVIKPNIANFGELTEQVKKEYMHVDTSHVLQVSNDGVFRITSQVLGDKMPRNFYRSTKHAAWKVARYHGNVQDSPDVSLEDRKRSLTYRHYLNLVSDAMMKTKQKEATMKAISNKGSFLVLTPYERAKYRSDLKEQLFKYPASMDWHTRRVDIAPIARITENLAKKKLDEAAKVSFKGRKSPKSSRGASPKRSRAASPSPTSLPADYTSELQAASDPATVPTTQPETVTAPSTFTEPGLVSEPVISTKSDTVNEA